MKLFADCLAPTPASFFACWTTLHGTLHPTAEPDRGTDTCVGIRCTAVLCVVCAVCAVCFGQEKTERRKVLLESCCPSPAATAVSVSAPLSCSRPLLCSLLQRESARAHPTNQDRSHRQPLHHHSRPRLSHRAALQASCLTLLSRPPYCRIIPHGRPLCRSHSFSFIFRVKRENPPILVAHTGSRCPATLAGAVTVQGFLALLSLLLLFPLASLWHLWR